MTSILAQFIKWLHSDFVVCVCVCPRLILHAHPVAEHANLLNAPHELLAPSSSGWSLSTHRCHHSRHLNTWPHPWRRQGRGWFEDPPFCQKRHVWAWEHYRISSKTANTNNKGGKKRQSVNNPSCDSVLKEQMDNYSTFGSNRVTAITSLTICQRRKKQERERPWEKEESQIWTLPSSSCDTGNWSASTDTCVHTRRLIIYEQGHLDAPARPWLRAKSIKLRGREQNRDSLCTGRWENGENAWQGHLKCWET